MSKQTKNAYIQNAPCQTTPTYNVASPPLASDISNQQSICVFDISDVSNADTKFAVAEEFALKTHSKSGVKERSVICKDAWSASVEVSGRRVRSKATEDCSMLARATGVIESCVAEVPLACAR